MSAMVTIAPLHNGLSACVAWIGRTNPRIEFAARLPALMERFELELIGYVKAQPYRRA